MHRHTLTLIGLAAALVLNAEIHNGTIGSAISWTVNTETQTLNIQGTGDLPDMEMSIPMREAWHTYKADVRHIVIGEGITAVGVCNFYRMTAVEDVSLPSTLTSIARWAFNGCTGLTAVSIPGSVSSVGMRSFSSCTSLASLTIGSGVKSIGEAAFLGSGVQSVVLPASLEEVGYQAFMLCSSLTEVTFPASDAKMSSQVFAQCQSLSSVTIPEGMTSLSSSLFDQCSALTEIVVPNSVTDLAGAFTSCGLKKVSLPAGCRMRDAFHNCPIETIIYRGTENQWWESSPCGTIETPYDLYIGDQLCTEATFPGDLILTGDDRSAFRYCKSISKVTIEVNETSDYPLFEHCDNLHTVSFLGTMSQWCQRDRYYAPMVDHGFKLYVNGVEAVDVTVPDEVEALYDYAFANVQNLHSLTLGRNTSTGNNVVSGCSALEFVELQRVVEPEYWTPLFEEDMEFKVYVPRRLVNVYKQNDYYKGLDVRPIERYFNLFFTAYEAVQSGETLLAGNEIDDASIQFEGSGTYQYGDRVDISNPASTDRYWFLAWLLPANTTPTIYNQDLPFGVFQGEGITPFYMTESLDIAALFNVQTDPTALAEASSQAEWRVEERTLLNPSARTISLHTAAGSLVYAGSDTHINLPCAGVYIVRAAGSEATALNGASKIVVK